jgi:L-lactate dehydrogenase (cytochrome)
MNQCIGENSFFSSQYGMPSFTSAQGRVLCLDDFESLAKRHLPRPLYSYVSGAVERNQSLAANQASFAAWSFKPRVLVDVSRRSLHRSILGKYYQLPFGIAPMGISALTAYRGDLVMARQAHEAGIPMILSGSSLIRLEEVIQVNPDAWFQAYLPGEAAGMDALVLRALAAGFKTLVITLDTPISSNREHNVRAGFHSPLRPSLSLAWQGLSHPKWLCGTFLKTVLKHGLPHFENNYAHRGAPILSSKVKRDMTDRSHFNWQHLARIRALWPGHLVLKGVLHTEDARRCIDAGADALIVSNHGGRQLDGAVAPLKVLPEIVAACPGACIMLDGGIRRGTDVLKALALGAQFVFVGRPFNYATAVGGASGLGHAIHLLSAEISRDLALLGLTALDHLSPSLLARS